FAGAHCQADVTQARRLARLRSDGKAFDGQYCVPGSLPAAREQILDAPSHHMRDDLVATGLRRVEGDDAAAVAQDGHAVTEREDFVQLVRDIDAADATRGQAAHDVEQDG